MTEQDPGDARAGTLATYLLEQGIRGIGPLSSAESLAAEYLGDAKYRDDDARVAALIKWETAKNFTTGFVTGLGGFITGGGPQPHQGNGQNGYEGGEMSWVEEDNAAMTNTAVKLGGKPYRKYRIYQMDL